MLLHCSDKFVCRYQIALHCEFSCFFITFMFLQDALCYPMILPEPGLPILSEIIPFV